MTTVSRKSVKKESDSYYVVSASFSPSHNYWTGFAVNMGVSGTHDNYDVLYNGDCDREHFATEDEAKEAARKAIE